MAFADEKFASAEGARLKNWQTRLEERRRTLAARLARADEQHAAMLQAEASAVELQRDVELREAALLDRQRAVKDRRDAATRREAEFAAQQSVAATENRRARASAETQQSEIETRWRALDEALTGASSRHAADEERIKRNLSDADDRDAMLREKIRGLSDREQHILAAERVLDHHQHQINSLDANAVHRMRLELKEREMLLMKD
jgi:hypothetical protein